MLTKLRDDARLFHRLRFPGREPSPWSVLRVGLSSRGMVMLGGHRLVQGLSRRANVPSALPLHRPVLRAVAMVVDYCVQVVTKGEVRVATKLAPGVYLSDRGYVVLGASAVGRGTVIHHRVTIGWSMKGSGTPEIGERVWIGPDSVVVGDIRIGDGVTILPGTVLTRSIPSNTLVQGNPARIVRRDFDNTELRRTLATEAGSP